MAVAPTVVEYVLTGQLVQAPFPLKLLYVPDPHWTQSPDTSVYPCKHSPQTGSAVVEPAVVSTLFC